MQDANPEDFTWAPPLMRAGYVGRGVTYLALAGFSLSAIWSGGEAQGMGETLAQLETSTWGMVALVLITLGLLSYFVWRVVCAIWDLEDYGTDAKGLIARIGQFTTGVIHGVLGGAAAAVLFTGGSGGSGGGSGSGEGGGSSIAKGVGALMSAPAGIWLVGIAGAVTIGAGIYYVHKAYSGKYRELLRANEFTRNWDWVLKAGLVAQGVVIGIIGAFLGYAALTANPNEAGGTGEALSWVSDQAYGQLLVTALCIGLLAFAVFCFVNARYRFVPKARDGGIETLASALA